LSQFAGGQRSASSPREEFQRVKPRWLTPAVIAGVTLAHLGVALFFIARPIGGENMLTADELSLDLVPEGDMFESEESAASDEAPPPEEMAAAAIEVPAPEVMDPEADAAAQKQQAKKDAQEEARERSEAQDQRRLGMKGGRAQSASVSKLAYAAMLAQSVRRHVASHSSPGAGVASCSFNVDAGGGLSVVSCTGSSSAHQSVLRRAIAATRAPPPPGGAFFASQRIIFQ